MLKKIQYYLIILISTYSCQSETVSVLQQEKVVVTNEEVCYNFSDRTIGEIEMDLKVDSLFAGKIILSHNENPVFIYELNVSRSLYPLQSEKGKWQNVSLKWDMANASMKVFINGKHQTTRLFETGEYTKINSLKFIPSNGKSKGVMSVRNVVCRGTYNEVPPRLKIVTFGDSTTAFRNTITGVYSQRLPELLYKIGIPNIVLNRGIGGSHTGRLTDNNRHKIQHAQDRLQDAVLDEMPDITLVCFGINDSWFDGDSNKPRIPLDDYERNLRTIVNEISDNESKILLMTPNALGKRHEKWRYDNLEKYVEVIRKIALEKNIPLVDQWKIYERYSLSGKDIDDLLLDGTHPNDSWHEELAGLIASAIQEMLKDQ
ncbi:hypothetical protein EYV94_23115 [Puteibacter caeruleilacunae]|nr:hypothetical protein EYV94_23115 [Puteibacter caeruleilacunae]